MYEDGISRIQEICKKQDDCSACPFHDKDDHSCIMVDEPSNWDVSKIVNIIRKRDLLRD